MLTRAFDRAESADPTVLWWDDGNYLEEILKQACAELDVQLKIAEQTPLELRTETADTKQVWYVPHVKNPSDINGDYDWFRDIEHIGYEIRTSIEDLTTHVFDGQRIQAWELRDVTSSETAEQRREIAHILREELTGFQLPTLKRLRTRIVTGGHTDPVTFVLENGVESVDDDPQVIGQIAGLLADEGVEPVANEAKLETIAADTQRWAVAEWLIERGASKEQFPPAFQPDTVDNYGPPKLQTVLSNTNSTDTLADEYLSRSLWPDIIANLEQPWELAECVVDAGLEHRLWDQWTDSLEAGEYQVCIERAEQRRDALRGSETYQGNYSGYGPDSPWVQTWEQATEVARLAHQLDTWDANGTDDVVSLYADPDDGTWQIDDAVLSLVVSGTPETDLPTAHPATDTLPAFREQVQSDYVTYLEELGKLVTDTVETEAPFVDNDHAHYFFEKESAGLESGQTVALFIIDALRLDLARQLAEQLRKRIRDPSPDAPDFTVEESVWLGTLPSETEFGKGALTPGKVATFQISLSDGELQARRNDRHVTTNRREQLLDGDGWTVTRADSSGWQSQTRVAYYQNDLDDIGEKELSDLETLLDQRVDSLADFIGQKVDQGDWDQAYVLTDHGFVLLPEGESPEKISRPSEATDSSRRWVAGEDIDAEAAGVLLDANTRLSYLNDPVNILVNPLERFSKQGLGDARFYHGGLLPQEFVLDFISITKE